MAVYLIVISLIPVYNIVFKNKKVVIGLSMFSMFLLMALRSSSLGVDIENYSLGYEYISELNVDELIKCLHLVHVADLDYPFSYESGYVVVNWVVSRLGFDFHGFLVIHAAFCLLSVAVFIKRYSTMPWLSCMMFACMGFYNFMFCILRQALAISILLWIGSFVEQRRTGKFLILVLISFSMHRSSIIILPLYYIYSRIKCFTYKHMLIYMLACVIFFMFMMAAVDNVLPIMAEIFGKVSLQSNENIAINNLFVCMVMIDLIILFLVRFSVFHDNHLRLAFYGLLIALPLEIIGLHNNTFARCVNIYWIYVCILVPNLLKKQLNLTTRVLVESAVVIVLLLFEAHLLHGSYQLIPYALYSV